MCEWLSEFKRTMKPYDEVKIIADFINFKKYNYIEISYARDLKKTILSDVDYYGAKIFFLEKNYPEAILTLKDNINEWIEVVSVVCPKQMEKLYPKKQKYHFRCKPGSSVIDREHKYCDWRYPSIEFNELYSDFKDDLAGKYQKEFVKLIEKNIKKKIDKKYPDIVQKYNKGILLVFVDEFFLSLKEKKNLVEYIANIIDKKFMNNNGTFKDIYLYSNSYPDVSNAPDLKIIVSAFYKIW